MTTTLAITPAEWASVQDGVLWLVRESPICDDRRHYILRPSPHNPLGTRRYDVHDDVRCANPCSDTTDGARRLVHQAPVEFVAAATPCETCDDSREEVVTQDGMGETIHCHISCDDCRIELVGSCLLCGGSGRTLGGPLGEDVGDCRCAMTEGLIVFGHAYAIGQPLPIVSGKDRNGEQRLIVGNGVWRTARHYGPPIDITNALAHYGPPESLVGKWALQMQVTP